MGKCVNLSGVDLGSSGTVEEVGSTLEVVDNLESDSTNKALSAKQGKALKEKIEALPEGLSADDEYLAVKNNKMTLKDRKYDSSSFSGMGVKYLRKNIENGRNILEQSQLLNEKTRYVISYDFDLNGKCLTVPDNSVLVFEGGSFTNGAVKGEDLVIESSAPCFDKTVTIVYGSLHNHILDLRWFKMETWTMAEYTANHKNNTTSVVSDTNRMIVNKHLKHRLLVPTGIYPFDDEITLVEEFSEYGESFDSGCSLNIGGVPFSEYSGRFERSAFVFPKSRGFVWKKGVGNGVNNVRNIYIEADKNIFHLWDSFNVSTMDTRTPDAWTNNVFENIEMVSWHGSGFYSPANYKAYVFFNKYRNIRGWFPEEHKGFWEGMCDMENVYEHVTLQYMGLDMVPFTGENYAVFVNQSALLSHGNFDRSKYVLVFKDYGIPNFQQRYENQGLYFSAYRCQFENLKEKVVYTDGIYASISVLIDNTCLVWYPAKTTKPIFDISRLTRFKLNTFYTVGVDKDKMLNINSAVGGKNIIDADIDLVVPFAGSATLNVSGRPRTSDLEDLSFFVLSDRTLPQHVTSMKVDFLNAPIKITAPQIIDDGIDLTSQYNVLKSTNLVFRRTAPYTLSRINSLDTIHTAPHFEGVFFTIRNDGHLLKVNTNKGLIALVKGMTLAIQIFGGQMCVIDSSPKKLIDATGGNTPIVFDGDHILSHDGTKAYFITERKSGIFALSCSHRDNAPYESHVGHLGICKLAGSLVDTVLVDSKVFWAVNSGTAGSDLTVFNAATNIGDEIMDGTVTFRYMGDLPKYKEITI